ncbi:MAG: hypothetical protein H0X40_00165 [Chthoniobacterales bacterium]|nr:hypothetical protein [Chthoniobacterales bacterium]
MTPTTTTMPNIALRRRLVAHQTARRVAGKGNNPQFFSLGEGDSTSA